MMRGQGPGKVAKCPSWSPGALSRRHTRAACYLRPGPARPWYELDKSRLCRGPALALEAVEDEVRLGADLVVIPQIQALFRAHVLAIRRAKHRQDMQLEYRGAHG